MDRACTILALAAVSALALPAASAETFELNPKKIKISAKNTDVFPEIELRPKEVLTSVTNEPKYRSKDPQRFQTTFGENGGLVVAFAVDERKGSGKGYDCLLADVSGSGDLAQGRKATGKPARRGSSYEDTAFSPFEIEIPGADGTAAYPVQARFSVSRNGPGDPTPRDSSMYLTALCALEGSVTFGEQKKDLVVFDANCNGVFGDKGTPTGRMGSTSGDKIWIGDRSPGLEDAYMGALPIGKYQLLDGVCYEMTFSGNRSVEITRAEVALGKLRVSNPGFLLELVEGQEVLYVKNDDGQELDVPVGNYKVNTPGFRQKGKGGIWELEGEPGACDVSFAVKEGEVTEIRLGAPLRLVISTSTRTQGTGIVVSLDFGIQGEQGEKYKYLRQNGKKVDLPEVSIRTERGKEVKKGQFEYG